MLYSLRQYEGSKVAKERHRIMKFYEEYGEKATVEAFGADRRVISRWRQRLKKGEGQLRALIPESTRPHEVRRPAVSREVVGFIREMRMKHPRLGKEKLKPLLEGYCRERGLSCPSESTIGNVIQRQRLFFQRGGRIYHDPTYGWAKRRERGERLKTKHPIRPAGFGHIVSDTVARVTDGVKDYFYSAMDARSKFALTLRYKQLTSRNMKDFYQRFQGVCPYSVRSWQSDNGAENRGEVEEQLKREGIAPWFSYPNCPKINASIERYNRTIQEEFIDNHLELLEDKPLFNQALADYLIFYNTQRPHKTLGLKSPVDYLIEQGRMSHMSMTYTRA
jgi:transposase InsO family protein